MNDLIPAGKRNDDISLDRGNKTCPQGSGVGWGGVVIGGVGGVCVCGGGGGGGREGESHLSAWAELGS